MANQPAAALAPEINSRDDGARVLATAELRQDAAATERPAQNDWDPDWFVPGESARDGGLAAAELRQDAAATKKPAQNEMRRTSLRPPQAIGAEASRPAVESPAAPPAAGATLRPPDRLALPAVARKRRRRLFHPKRGWLRRLERAGSNWLARRVYPRVPGLNLIYERILRRQLTLSEADIELANLPPAFCGLRILLITDVHAGPFISAEFLAQTFRRLMALEPDLILLGGDLTTCRAEEFTSQAEAFRVLRAPLGVFAVMGNHDYYGKQPAELRRSIAAAGIPVLQNWSVELQRQGQGLFLAGVDDLLLGQPDLDAALAGTRPPVILVSHNPDLFFDAVRAGVALMLSGHTHAGQIRVPGLPVLVRQSRYRLDEGRYRAAGTELVVSRGLGAVGLPWRAACPPETVLLTLRRRAS